MNFYLAPMEGLTTYIYRGAYAHYFGGVSKYFTPFISSRKMNRRELDEILPEHNEGMYLIPQILTNRSDEFLAIAGQLADYGYDTVNLNLGCPSGTVVAKKRGAGLLCVPQELEAFLSEIYEKCSLKISIKTRIGIADQSEWETLLPIFEKFPVEELIIHPRLQKEHYSGTPHVSAYQKAMQHQETGLLTAPLCYNGDIVSVETLQALLNKTAPSITTVMIGRGILQNPYLISQLQNIGAISPDTASSDKTVAPDKARLRTFHDEIYARYQQRMSGEMPVLYKMKDLWALMHHVFRDSEKPLKKIRKASHFSDYEAAVNEMFTRELHL